MQKINITLPVDSNRQEIFDVIKGIAILLMVLGHSLPPFTIGYYIRNGFIYSFHMPLFFIVSGYFYKPKPTTVQIKKDFKLLIIPYLFTAGLLVFYGLFTDLYGNVTFPNETIKWFRICFYGSYNPNVPLGNWVGPVWFLIALFWCRTAFSFLFSDDKKKNVIYFVVIPMVISYIFKFIYVPLYVLQGLTALIFYYIGYYVKENDLLNKKYPFSGILLLLVVWIYCIFFSHIDMQVGYYDNFIINVIGAVSASYFIYILSKFIVKRLLIITRLLAYAGRCSLIVLCFHSIDFSIEPVLIPKIQSMISMPSQGHFFRYFIVVRFIYTFLAILIIPKIKILRGVFNIK
jgi:fucose 4-O-acetylase-like acetyltransferase